MLRVVLLRVAVHIVSQLIPKPYSKLLKSLPTFGLLNVMKGERFQEFCHFWLVSRLGVRMGYGGVDGQGCLACWLPGLACTWYDRT